jgi:hypothetical protein
MIVPAAPASLTVVGMGEAVSTGRATGSVAAGGCADAVADTAAVTTADHHALRIRNKVMTIPPGTRGTTAPIEPSDRLYANPFIVTPGTSGEEK